MTKKSNLLVKESNAIARAKLMPPSSSLWDERIIAVFASLNRIDENEFKLHLVDARKDLYASSLSTAQYRDIKKAIDRLTQSYFVIYGKGKAFRNFPIFEQIGLDEQGNIAGKFNPALKEHYLELERQFSLRSLPEFQALGSTYSQALFRYLNSFKNFDEVTVKLSDLHDALSTPPSFRKYDNLKRRVLEPAHQEITAPKDTSLYFEWEPVKQGLRKVVAIRFIFNPVKVRLIEKKANEAEEAARFSKLQGGANECYVKHRGDGQECKPKTRSPKCKYCTEHGRMFIEELKKRNKVGV
jgi:plasmid replication initiation protein